MAKSWDEVFDEIENAKPVVGKIYMSKGLYRDFRTLGNTEKHHRAWEEGREAMDEDKNLADRLLRAGVIEKEAYDLYRHLPLAPKNWCPGNPGAKFTEAVGQSMLFAKRRGHVYYVRATIDMALLARCFLYEYTYHDGDDDPGYERLDLTYNVWIFSDDPPVHGLKYNLSQGGEVGNALEVAEGATYLSLYVRRCVGDLSQDNDKQPRLVLRMQSPIHGTVSNGIMTPLMGSAVPDEFTERWCVSEDQPVGIVLTVNFIETDGL